MPRLNYHHLYYFWQVAKTGNLTKTAGKLHLSQSALSSQIKQLESTMETQLFVREGRRLVLTEAGQRALHYADDIFSKGDELEALLRTGIAAGVQTLRIGVLATMSRNFIESFIEPLIPRQNVRYSLHAQSQARLINNLSNHQLDLALTNIEVLGSEQQLLQCQALARQTVSVIGPPGLGLGESFDHGYAAMPWVLPVRETPIRSAFDGYCAQHQFAPQVVAEADDMAMLRLLARDSGALAVLPDVVVKDELAAQVLVKYLAIPNTFENFYAVTVKRQYSHQLISELLATFFAKNAQIP